MLADPSLLSQLMAPAASRKCLDLPEKVLEFERAFSCITPFLMVSTKGRLWGDSVNIDALTSLGKAALTFVRRYLHMPSRYECEWLVLYSRLPRRRISRVESREFRGPATSDP